ncbi:MAG: signal peptidase I [Ruminococcus sp.]|nr:signal peptidase I [Ruminococcus sp.]
MKKDVMPLEEKTPVSPPEKDPSAKKKKKRPTARSYALSLLIKLGVTAGAVALLLKFVCGVYVCHDNSSFPMIKDGDLCITYRLSDLKQGDEIAYKLDGKIRFGRVIALAGDSVEIFDDYISVNGLGFFEDAVFRSSPPGSALTYPYTVPENCVFVLNDYRTDVTDSRTYGGISLDDVQGAVMFVMRRRGI